MKEAHQSRYSIHLGCNKMYRDLKIVYWWPGMKKSIARYVGQCDTCQRVKIEHSETRQKFVTVGDSKMEVGTCHHGFRNRATKKP